MRYATTPIQGDEQLAASLDDLSTISTPTVPTRPMRSPMQLKKALGLKQI